MRYGSDIDDAWVEHFCSTPEDARIIEALLLDETNDPKEELLVIDLTEKLPTK